MPSLTPPQASREWSRFNAEFSLWAEFGESQAPEVIAERCKLPSDEQLRLDRSDFRDCLLKVKFPGTSESKVDDLLSSLFGTVDGPEPAVSESTNPGTSVDEQYPVKITHAPSMN